MVKRDQVKADSLQSNGIHVAEQQLAAAIAELGPWFHNLHLPGGIQTAPDHFLGDFPAFKWQQLSPHLPQDLRGWRVLDIGCNAGYYTFELAKRGGQVVGIDVDPHYLRQATWAAEQVGLANQVTFRQMQVYDLAHEADTYDLVLFMGVFYHLRYPMLGLDIVTQKVKRLLVFQSLTMPGEEVYLQTNGLRLEERAALQESGWPKMAFLEHELAADRTNWWAPNHACVEAMLRSSGMRILTHPGHEIYLCEPNPTSLAYATTWGRYEYMAATGQS
ncbi:MAG: TIGR04290 family methyltransferase [Caldilineaceae bacterium]